MKYIELVEFPSTPVRFFVDRNNPSNSSGVVEVHYWSDTPPSAPPFATRIWLADIGIGGGSFLFQPTPSKKFISLFKKNGSGTFDALCFKFVAESRLFVPQTFG
ncbi:MAG: hypothetical protein AB1861_04985 [Cyanobacteriota bacterium]